MADLIKIYQDMVSSLEYKIAAEDNPAVRAGLAGLLDGARTNLADAKEAK